MNFPEKYKILNKNIFTKGIFSISPLRYQDRLDIMKWRNEQMYHLRQNEILTVKNQEAYFKNIVANLFNDSNPPQILFSYFKNEICIGYGGLVHINWEKKQAEVSFIMDTKLENKEFEIHWSNFLYLLKKVAFEQLKWNNIYTYAYNLRPHLYPVLEKNDFKLKEVLKNEIEIEGKFVDVLIHQCNNPLILISLRKATENDMLLMFNWSNDELVRSQSFNSSVIKIEEHKQWFYNKLKSENSLLLINEIENSPIGIVRFEIEEQTTSIGVLLDSNYRGKGLSSKMLELSCKRYFELFKKPVLAYIKATNLASIKTFEKAGFKFYKEDAINNNPIVVYKLEINAK